MSGTALLSYLLSRLTPGVARFFAHQPKTSAGKGPLVKFVIDFSRPAGDGVFDGADFEKFLHDRIKVDDKAGQLGDSIKLTRDCVWPRTELTQLFVELVCALQLTANLPLLQIFRSPNGISNT